MQAMMEANQTLVLFCVINKFICFVDSLKNASNLIRHTYALFGNIWTTYSQIKSILQFLALVCPCCQYLLYTERRDFLEVECERYGKRDAIFVTDRKCQLLAMSSSFLLNSKIPLLSLMPFSIFGSVRSSNSTSIFLYRKHLSNNFSLFKIHFPFLGPNIFLIFKLSLLFCLGFLFPFSTKYFSLS